VRASLPGNSCKNTSNISGDKETRKSNKVGFDHDKSSVPGSARDRDMFRGLKNSTLPNARAENLLHAFGSRSRRSSGKKLLFYYCLIYGSLWLHPLLPATDDKAANGISLGIASFERAQTASARLLESSASQRARWREKQIIMDSLLLTHLAVHGYESESIHDEKFPFRSTATSTVERTFNPSRNASDNFNGKFNVVFHFIKRWLASTAASSAFSPLSVAHQFSRKGCDEEPSEDESCSAYFAWQNFLPVGGG
jgi:hypothetical protein